MIIAEAHVRRCDDQFIYVDVQRPGGCDSCDSRSSCGTSMLAPLFSRHDAPIKVARAGARARLPGEKVRIGIQEKPFIRGTLLLYLLPLLGLIGGAMLGQWLAESFFPSVNETPVILGGLSGLTAAFWLIKRISTVAAKAPDIVILDDTPSRRVTL